MVMVHYSETMQIKISQGKRYIEQNQTEVQGQAASCPSTVESCKEEC